MVNDEWNLMYGNIRHIEPVTFLRRYMMSNFRGTVTKNKLFDNLKSRVKNEPIEIFGFVEKLNNSSEVYQRIYNGIGISKKIDFKLKELQMIEVSPSYTLLLKIIPLFEDNVMSEKDFLNILNTIEKFHIIFGVCDQRTSDLDKIYNKICTTISEEEPNSDNTVKIVKNILYKRIKDLDFISNFSGRSFEPSSKRTKYILWKISKPTKEQNLNIEEVDTEHILPNRKNKKWIKYLMEIESLSEEGVRTTYNDFKNRIGNLTIIQRGFNKKMSNKTFDEKKIYYKKSNISITNELGNIDIWSFSAIDKRSEELANVGRVIWNDDFQI